MAHDVFISHAHNDKPIADAMCAKLEANGIRCWIAPRDVLIGQTWRGAIIDGINASRIFILIFSSHSNRSPDVLTEIERAVTKGLWIIPFRIEDAPPSTDMEYLIGSRHWLDALTLPMENHLEFLAESVRLVLSRLPARAATMVGKEEELRSTEKAEAERKAEQADAERKTRKRAEQERRERECVEAERLAREKEEQERLARERAERVFRETAIIESQRKERERAREKAQAQEKAEQERLARERAGRIAREKAITERQRMVREQAEQEQREREQAEAERAAERERQAEVGRKLCRKVSLWLAAALFGLFIVFPAALCAIQYSLYGVWQLPPHTAAWVMGSLGLFYLSRYTSVGHYFVGVYLTPGDYEIAELREAIRLKPDYAKAHNSLARALTRKDDWDGAIAEAREAIRLKPDYADAHNSLATALTWKDDWDGALAEARDAIRLNPNHARAHDTQGRALERKGETESALGEYQKAASLGLAVAKENYDRLLKLTKPSVIKGSA